MAEIFHAAVHEIAAKDYTPAQCTAWSRAPRPVLFTDREADGRKVWVACDEGTPTGFIELKPSGHIDCFYCHPRGSGAALYDALEAEAKDLDGLIVEASDTARPFFEARGFEAIGKQQHTRRAQTLSNTLMVKRF